MIFLYTRTDVPNHPFWILHLESLSLAKLVLQPGGPHLLHVHADAPMPDSALTEMLEAINEMGGQTESVDVVTSLKLPNDFPASLSLVPKSGPGLAIFNHGLGLGLAWTADDGALDPVWKKLPESTIARHHAIDAAIMLADVRTKKLLEELYEDRHVASLWLQRSDQLASSS